MHNITHLKLANELNLQWLQFYFTAAPIVYISVAITTISYWLATYITSIAKKIIV